MPAACNRARKTLARVRRYDAVRMLVVMMTLMGVMGLNISAARAESIKSAAEKIIGAKGCVACHYIPGIPAAIGTIGPSLKNLKNRPRIAGGVLENTDENLRDWLKNPKELKPDTMMPNMGLDNREIEILITFFKTI